MYLTIKGTFGKSTPKKRLEAEGKANRPVLAIPSGCCGIIFAHCRMLNMERALSCGLRERGTKNRATLSPHLLACKSGHTECIALTPQLHLLPFQDVFQVVHLGRIIALAVRQRKPYTLFYFFDFSFQPLKFSLGIDLFRDVRNLVADHILDGILVNSCLFGGCDKMLSSIMRTVLRV